VLDGPSSPRPRARFLNDTFEFDDVHNCFGTSASLSGDACPHRAHQPDRAGAQLALDLSNAALQVSVNAQELDAEARRVREIAESL
jgi:hypothetical protein